MAEEKNTVVDQDTVYVAPTTDEENVEKPEGTEGGAEGATPTPPEAGGGQPVAPTTPEPTPPKPNEGQQGGAPAAPAATPAAPGTEGSPAPVPGETPRERALRIETDRLRKQLRQQRAGELREGVDPTPGTPPAAAPAPGQRPLTAAQQAVLAKYKPDEINALREVLPVIAEGLGYARTEDLSKIEYSRESDAALESFMEQHPEYSEDTTGALWGHFKSIFQSDYKAPKNPKDWTRVLNKVHNDVFGIKPAAGNGALTAQRQKVETASHAGTSGPTRSAPRSRPQATSGLRTDMLQGFSEEEIAAMTGGGE